MTRASRPAGAVAHGLADSRMFARLSPAGRTRAAA
jgi:hypothetical protein